MYGNRSSKIMALSVIPFFLWEVKHGNVESADLYVLMAEAKELLMTGVADLVAR